MATIVAQASAVGHAGIGIIRLSGHLALKIAKKITKKTDFKPRYTTYCTFYDQNEKALDQGLCLYFRAPQSFTGEDVIEFHAHGSPVVLELLIDAMIQHGARLAKPGEFSQRAFLNQKIDLTQAEAICDLIHSQNAQAAKGAFFSMRGDFSKKMHHFKSQLLLIRSLIEADINFSEDLDELNINQLSASIQTLLKAIKTCLKQSIKSNFIHHGIQVLLLGPTNTGKSSLFNALIGQDEAIVTNIEGTTRDRLKGIFWTNQLAIEIIDTAGLRETNHYVEKIGIQKGLDLAKKVDVILFVKAADKLDSFDFDESQFIVPPDTPIIDVINKIDLIQDLSQNSTSVYVSAKNRTGLEALKKAIVKKVLGQEQDSEQIELPFLARKRHILSLEKAYEALSDANSALIQGEPIEIAAQYLNYAQQYFGKITGEIGHSDLLQSIFSNFCLGK